MNPYRIAFTLFGLVYAIIALAGFAIAIGVTIIGVAGMLWCGAGWFVANKYL